MFKKFLIEFLKNFKWVLILCIGLITLIGLWIGCAWTLGWLIDLFFNLKEFSRYKYIGMGSCILVFVLFIQIITIIFFGWALYSWGRTRQLNKKKA